MEGEKETRMFELSSESQLQHSRVSGFEGHPQLLTADCYFHNLRFTILAHRATVTNEKRERPKILRIIHVTSARGLRPSNWALFLSKDWYPRQGSNLRPFAPEANALIH